MVEVAKGMSRAVMKLREMRQRRSWEAEQYAFDTIARSSIFIRETNTVYLPVSKAANTSLKIALARHRPTSSQAIHWTPTKYGLERLRDLNFTPNDLVANKQRWTIITVVRNPVRRFLSAYRDKIGSGDLTPLRRELARHYDRDVAGTFSIDDLIGYVSSTATFAVEEHVRPQWSCNGAPRVKFNDVGYVETLTDDLRRMASHGIIPERLAGGVSRENVASVPPNDVQLTTTQHKRIVELYARDYELFDFND